MKQAYRAADKQVEKRARLVDKGKGKDKNKVQFINERYEKLKRKDFPKTQESKHSKARKRSLSKFEFPERKTLRPRIQTARRFLKKLKLQELREAL